MHNTPVAATPKAFDLTSSAFLLVAFLTGIAGALQTPTLSLFLTDEVHARPGMVGFFFTGSAVIGILVSQFLAGRSDKKGDRKNLIVFCCVLGMLACVLFAWNRNYFILLFVGVFLGSFGSTANPQMFALAREHADRTGREAVMFSSILRAQVSLAWVIGPPLAYALAMGFSFTVMYLSAAVAFVVCGVMVWLFLPSMSKNVPLATGAVEAPRRNRRDTLLLFVICTLMWGTNSLYIINMPLFIINELHLPEKLAGIMMGTAAGLEINHVDCRILREASGQTPVDENRRCRRIFLLCRHAVGPLSGDIAWLTAAERDLHRHPRRDWHALFQDLMPGQAGSATTLYTNTIRVGWIIAGSLAVLPLKSGTITRYSGLR